MSIRYFVCDNCKDAKDEYNEFICENEHQLCTDCLPSELVKFGIADDIYLMCNKEFKNNNILQKYIKDDEDNGFCLKKEYCPCCQKDEIYKDDEQYQEYLRLKAIYE